MVQYEAQGGEARQKGVQHFGYAGAEQAHCQILLGGELQHMVIAAVSQCRQLFRTARYQPDGTATPGATQSGEDRADVRIAPIDPLEE